MCSTDSGCPIILAITPGSNMVEYTVHFQKGSRVGTRRLRMEHVEALNAREAIIKAKALFPTWREEGFRLTRVDHLEAGRIVID